MLRSTQNLICSGLKSNKGHFLRVHMILMTTTPSRTYKICFIKILICFMVNTFKQVKVKEQQIFFIRFILNFHGKHFNYSS